MKDDVIPAAIKAAPPSVIVGWSYIAGLPLDKWLTVVTIIYVLLQTFFLLRDRLKKRRDRK